MEIQKKLHFGALPSYTISLGVGIVLSVLAFKLAQNLPENSILPYATGAIVLVGLAVYHILFTRSINRHIEEAIKTQQIWVKSRQLNDENYRRLQVFLGSIPELNKLLEAHLAFINESTEKASLAIISKLFLMEERVAQILKELDGQKLQIPSAILSQESIIEMRHAIIDILSHTQFQDISRQQIEVVTKGLALCAQYSDEVAHILDSNNPEPLTTPNLQSESMKALRESYTMEAQRIVHFNATGDDSALDVAGRPAIELF